MTIDSVEAAGDSTDIFENWEDRYENVIWNGREITILDQQRTDQFIAKAQAIIQSLNTEKKHQSLVRHVKQLDSLEDRAFDFAPVEYEFILINSQLSESELIQCGLFKRVWDGMRKGAKKAAKAFKKVIDAMKKAAEEVAHGTKKAAEKVADFVKDHKKETLIAAAIIAAIAGAFIISGALSGGAARAGGGTPTRRKEDEKDDQTSPPSDPPPLPDWVSDLLKSTTPDFSPDKLTEASLDNAKKEAHNAWNLFNNLKSDTENGLASLKKFEPEFNPSSHAVNTILNTLLQDPQKQEFSKNLISSQNWADIIQSGHEKIDQAFITLLSSHQTAIPPPPPPKPSPSFLDKIRLGLEIIGRGMMEPELLDPNSSLDQFFKNETCEKMTTALENPRQTIKEFLATIEQDLKNKREFSGDPVISQMQDPNTSQNFIGISKVFELNRSLPLGTATSSLPLEKSRCFRTRGLSLDGMLITFINGMNNTYEEALRNADHIRALCPGNPCIEGIYNHSNGKIGDSIEIAMLNYNGYSPITVKLLTQKWIEFHDKNKDRPDAKILHFCHSQGAIHTKNALNQLPEEIRNRIIVIGIAPAKVVSEQLCFQAFDYASKKDIVPLGGLLVSYWSACNQGEVEREEFLINDSKIHSELIMLEPHDKATNFDHEFQSPTFHEIIKKNP